MRLKSILFLFMIGSFWASAQIEIKGNVATSDNQPLAGVSVVVKNTSNGVQTDFDGNYSITANTGDVLVFTYLGMLSKKVTVDDQSTIDVVLEEDSAKLDEVVLTGYSTQSRGNLSAAISTIKSDVITATPVISASQGLQGRVPGVTVSSSSGPGGGTSVRIRGYSTINNNDPLYIVDGVPIQGDINFINPNDIASMSVLKDAAASIYGSRAASGVILITTKQGSPDGKARLSYQGYYGMQTLFKGYENASPTEQAQISYLDANNRGVAPDPLYGGGATPVLPDYLSGDPNKPYDFNTNRLIKSNKEGTDWIGEIFKSAPIQNHQISASGGNENGRYLFSGNYFEQEGLLLNTGYKRATGRVNSDYKINDHLRVGENITVSYSQRDGHIFEAEAESPIMMAYRMLRIIPIYDEGGSYAGTSPGGLGNAQNPVAGLNRDAGNKKRNISLFGSAFAEINFLKDFKFKSNIGIKYVSNFDSDFTYKTYESSENTSTNQLEEFSDYASNIDWYNTLSYSKSIGDHTISAMAGQEFITDKNRDLTGTRTEYPYENINFQVLDAGTGQQNSSGTAQDYVLESFFGKIDYVYAGKYIFSGSIRHDTSSRFIGSNRSAIFPSASAAWKLSEENFFSPIKNVVNNLKLRASWGQLGGQGIDNRYPTYSIYSSNLEESSYAISGSNNTANTGYFLSSNSNKDIKWEISTITDIGIDLQLLDSKFNLAFDWYQRDTKDILYNPPVPATAGIQADTAFINIGDMTNTGYDFSVGYGDTKGDFVYNVSLNGSHYKNTVERISDNDKAFVNGEQYRDIFPSRTQKGQAISSFYGYKVIGIYQDLADVNNSPDQVNKGIGRYKYQDINGDDKIDGEDRTFIGSPHPDFTYGLNVNLKYKNFDLALFLQGVSGNDIFNATKYYTHHYTFISGKSTDLLYNSWSPSNTQATYGIPINSAAEVGLEKSSSSLYIEDGSYLRLKNLQIGYNLPKEWLKNVGLEKVRIYLQGQNMFTLTNYSGLDPEISSQSQYNDKADLDIGVDRGIYPSSATYLVGLNVNL